MDYLKQNGLLVTNRRLSISPFINFYSSTSFSSTPVGLDDVADFPYLISELVKRGWSDLDLEKLAGRNLVRVFREVEQVRVGQRWWTFGLSVGSVVPTHYKHITLFSGPWPTARSWFPTYQWLDCRWRHWRHWWVQNMNSNMSINNTSAVTSLHISVIWVRGGWWWYYDDDTTE